MQRRDGVTLIEVLVAIFVMGIGLMAILALFPLGALRMAQAIQDDHCAHAGANAAALAVAKNVMANSNLSWPDTSVTPNVTYDLFKYRDAGPTAAPVTTDAADDNGPSYPILVDPVGNLASIGTGKNWVKGTAGSLRRIKLDFTIGSGTTLPWYTFLDDIYFDTVPGSGYTGQPNYALPIPTPPAKKKFDRDTRYSWAYVMQRPRTADTNVVNLTVLVFNQRPLALTGSLNLPEDHFTGVTFNTATSTTNPNTITITGSPAIQPGGWIMDCTTRTVSGKKFQHAYFYRVVGITEDTANGKVILEVQQPIRYPEGAMPTTFTGQAIIFDGLAEVFERGPTRLP